jgi:tetratricopeptide (TPR) repeat protein
LFRGVYYDFFTKFQFAQEEPYEKPIKDYKKAISLNPRSALVHYLLGHVYYTRSLFVFPKAMADYGRATKALTKAIQLNPEYQAAYKLRAAVHLDKAQYKSSMWAFKAPASELKYNPQDEYRLAIKDFDKAVQLDPNDAGLYHDRAMAHKELSEYDDAVRDLTKAIGMKHDAMDWPRSAYEIRAHVYEAMEKYEDAINDYTKAFEIWEKMFGAYHKEHKLGSSIAQGILENRAAAYRKSGNPQQAVIDYMTAIELAQAYPLPMNYAELGDTYLELKKPEDALKAYDHAIEVNAKKDYGPGQEKSDTLVSEYFVKKAKVYTDLKKFDLAIESYRKALYAVDDLPPYKGELYKNMGMIYRNLGINQEAIKAFTLAVKYLPLAGEDPLMVYFDIGSIYSEMGNHNEAIRVATEMISLQPTFYGTYVMRGEEYGLINEYHKAIDDFSKAIDLQPTNQSAYYDRGYSLIKIGKYKQGLDDVKIAARLGHKQAQELLAKQGVDW